MAFDHVALGIELPGAMTMRERRALRSVVTGLGRNVFPRNWPGAVGGVDWIGEIEADFDDFALPLDVVRPWDE